MIKLPFYIHKVGAGFPSPATDYKDDVDLNTHNKKYPQHL